MQFYTGLDNVDMFTGVLASLGPAAHKLKYLYATRTLEVRNQLLLTLIKLRLYITNFQLGRMFEVKQFEVYNIFVTWVKFMSKQWRKINIWPEKGTVRQFAPTDFKTKFTTTRAIFDGTECPIKSLQQQLQVVLERSNLTQMVDQGDSVMADKGFDVQDLFAPMNVTVNISTVLRYRKISSKRVHVERIIGLAKTYKILKNHMNHTVTSCNRNTVCFMLTNFRKSIVPKNA